MKRFVASAAIAAMLAPSPASAVSLSSALSPRLAQEATPKRLAGPLTVPALPAFSRVALTGAVLQPLAARRFVIPAEWPQATSAGAAPATAAAAVPGAMPAPASSAAAEARGLAAAAGDPAAVGASLEAAYDKARRPSQAPLVLTAASPLAPQAPGSSLSRPVSHLGTRLRGVAVGAPAVGAATTSSPGAFLVFSMILGAIVGVMLLTRWTEGSVGFQKYLARRRWVTANQKSWKEAPPEAQALVEAQGARIAERNRAGRANSWKDVWLMLRNKHPSDAAAKSSAPAAGSRPRLWGRADKADKPAEGIPTIRFADVAGQNEAKAELVKVVDFIKNPERYRRLGAKGFKGVLLFGPPGTGKTLMARAAAGEAGATWVEENGSNFVNTFVGVGPKNIRAAFAKARGDGKKPGILFIDEIDAVGKKRSDGEGNQEYENTLNALLAEMSSPTNANVIVMAATNRPELLDPALMRGRRFGLKVPVGLPDVDGREHILKIHAKGMPLAVEAGLRRVAELTPGLSGADLEEIANDAAMLAAERGGETVSAADFRRAIDRQTIGHERRLVMSAEEKKVVAFHEAGHALIAWLAPSADPITKITIVPHGLQALGLVQTLSAEERRLYSEHWLLDRIAVALGGRVAEQMATGHVYSGAQNDFEQATRIARMMVMKFGMSAALGHVSYDMDGERPAAGRAMSERLRRQIEEEVQRILSVQTERVRSLLQAHRGVLDALAGELQSRETLREDDLQRIMPPRPGKN